MKIQVLLLDDEGGLVEFEESKERDAFVTKMLYQDLVTLLFKKEIMIDKHDLKIS